MTARQSTTAVLCLAALLAARLIPFAEATWIPHHSNVAVRDDPVRGTKEEYALGSGPGYNYVEGSQGRHHEPQDHDVIPIWDLGPSQGAAHPAGGLRVSVSVTEGMRLGHGLQEEGRGRLDKRGEGAQVVLGRD